jgi:hypothetical protein
MLASQRALVENPGHIKMPLLVLVLLAPARPAPAANFAHNFRIFSSVFTTPSTTNLRAFPAKQNPRNDQAGRELGAEVAP